VAVVVDATAEATLDELVASQRDRLLDKLARQRVHAAELWAWYHGEQEYPVVKAQYRDAYRLLIELSRTPWARLIVDTIAERLHVTGFRSGAPATDAEAWRLFKASSLDADERLVYTEALVTGTGYLSVSGEGTLAPESVFEVTHEPEPGNRRRVAAAIKVYPLEPTLREWALELYRPDATYRWQATLSEPLEPGGFPLDTGARKPPDWETAEPFVAANPLGVVPIVPFENRATILGGGVSELEDCIPLLRRIDKLTLDLLLTSDVASFRQKWATGLEVPVDPETGKRVEPWKAAVDRVWIAEGEAGKDAKFGTFEASDLGQYLRAIEACVAALCAIARVPAHYLMQSNLANPPTAESLVSSESGLVAKCRERQRRFGESHERATALSLELAGAEARPALEVIWQDAEMRNPAQVADAATKLQTLEVPRRALWEYVGATPQQIAEWTLEAAGAELVALAAGPSTPPRGAAGPPA
jgi:Phage portal protein, SPP1 Gp6-like